ncbi:DNA polymerase zeta [Gamsiella multidivaricata]|nr:DNA polymerase zeta [Gamsiella multidivaricata]
MTAYESVDFLCPRMISDPDESFEARSQIASQIPFVYNEADSSILVDESIISQTGEVFEEDNMNSRKEILKGLAGLQGIDEQIGDDEFPLPDINDFQDEVFIDEADEAGGTDEADIWDGIGSFDLEGHIEEADSAIVNMVDRRNIPQFDGGGDEHPLYDDNKGEDAARNWRKVTQNPGRKRTRFSSSSLPAPQEPPAQSPKRFCEVVASGSTASRSVLRPRSFRQSDRPSRIHVDMSNSNNRPATLTDLTPVDDSIEDGDYSDFDIEDVSKGSGIIPHLRERFKQPRRARDSPKPITGYDYPEPASPSRTYFLSAMDEMWSSPSPPLERPAFLYSPPRPSSPDLASAHTVYVSDLLPQSSVDKPTHQHTVTLNSPAAPRSPEVNRLSTHNCRASTIVNQTFLGDEPLAQDDVPYGAQMDDENSGVFHETHLKRRSQEDISKHVLAEDSIIHDSFDDVLSQSTIPEPIPAETSVLHGSTPHIYRFAIEPPTTQDLLHSFTEHGLPNVVYQKPYFSNEQDVPSKAKAFGGKEFRVQSNGIKTMPIFNGALGLNKSFLPGEGFRFWEPIYSPPSRATIQSWLKEEEVRARLSLRSAAGTSTQKRKERISQIEGPTQKNPFGYKNSPTKTAASVAVEKDFLDVLSLEVYCQTRGGLLPDPKYDQILAVFYCWQTDREGLISNGWAPGTGIFTHAKAGMMRKLAAGRVGFDIYVAENEGAMMNAVIDHVRELDPDILAGYEVHKLSWGYLVDRYQTLFGLDMSKLLSRVRPLKAPVLTMSILEARDSYNTKHHAGLKFPGRHLFNVWRLIRGEVALTNYGFGNVVFHVLQQRIPHYTHETLTKWWLDGIALHQSRVIRHYLHRVQYTLQLIESQELISRTSEFARVFGVDFFSVISRGSQYKVESMMVRLAKPENYIMISPSRAQVAAQRALEVIPMVMEPESGFYEDPVVVLDFQSLYPSVMIAYNICYSTCLGKLGGGTKIGVLTEYKIKDGALPLMEEHLHIAPNNVMYVNQGIRRGLLGRMLAEILDTRVMIKKAMKEYPGNRSLLKLLEARQLSLKFIANVTYGYTSASYSGRMPGIEIADSIVLSARETLERAIRFVNDSPKWNARVVYGDTDSMFVHLKGRTRQEAFEIGYDIAETITRMNPRPVKLKFEKVYDKCFLVTKKRYVGSSYESPNQKEPIFDAKGIETIRRDGVPAVQKIMETCIKTMFRTQDLSLVKSYFVRQLGKVLEGRVLVPDLMFGKEVRMGGYSEKGVPPPGAVVSARRMELDPRSEPQHGERVPYVVVYGDLGARLTDQVVEPKQLLVNKNLRLNGEYYIRKHIIPSMERIFQLAGADVKSWYEEMPRVQRAVPFGHSGVSNGGTGRSASTTPMVATTVVPTEVTAAMVAAQEERQQQLVQAGDDQFIENENVEVDELAAAGDAEPSEGVPNTEPEGMSVRPKFLPRRRGGKGYVSVGSRIDRYYQSQLCVICSKMIVGQKPNRDLCADCMSEQGRIKSMLVMQNRLSNAEKMFRATVDVCSSCCRSAPNGGSSVGDIENGVANSETDLVACESLECGVFWQRRRAQDSLSIAQHLTNRVMKDLEDFSYK